MACNAQVNDRVAYIVDDDESVRRSLRWLLESAHLTIETFASGEAFLEEYDPSSPACLLLDIRMSGLSGLEVQERLIEKGCRLPVIIMTGHGDVPACKRAFKHGAFDFIEKPVDDHVLIDLVHEALAADVERRRRDRSSSDEPAVLPELTRREAEILNLIVNGKSQKQIATELNISFQTTAKHRAKILAKLGVNNDVELARLVLSTKTIR